MTIYRISIVKRNLPKENPCSQIVNFVQDFEFRKRERMELKKNQLIKKGHDIDITVWDKTADGDYNLI